jgi:hypothetical protein
MHDFESKLKRLILSESEYHLRLELVVTPSKLGDGWLGKLLIETGSDSGLSYIDPEINIGRGVDAVSTVQNVLFKLAQSRSVAAQTLIEAGLLFGERSTAALPAPPPVTELPKPE